MNANTENTKIRILLAVLHFTSALLQPRQRKLLFSVISKLNILYQCRKKNMDFYLLQVVPQEILTSLMKSSSPDENALYHKDPSTCVLVSNYALKSLGVVNGSWVNLKLRNNIIIQKSNESCVKISNVVVRIYALNDLTYYHALISDVMYHNLNKHNLISIAEEHLVQFTPIDGNVSDSNINLPTFAPPIAEKAQIALIQPSYEIDCGILSDILKLFFRVPRYVIKGFIFCVDLKPFIPFLNVTENPFVFDTLYFNVIELSGSNDSSDNICGCMIKRDETALHQVANQQCYFPIKTVSVINHLNCITAKNYDSYTIDICPSGLYHHYKHFLELLQPFLMKNEKLEVNPTFLLYGPQGVGKREIVKSVALSLGVNLIPINCLHLQSTTTGNTVGKFKYVINKAKKWAPCIVLLKNIEVMFKDKDGDDDPRLISAFHSETAKLFSSKTLPKPESYYPIFLIATSDTLKDHPTSVPPSIARSFLNVIHIASPNEVERASILNWLLKRDSIGLERDLSVKYVAAQMSGFLYNDIVAMLTNAISHYYKSLKSSKNCVPFADDGPSKSEIILKKKDFEHALDIMHAAYADAIGAPRIPAVSWKDVGGLSQLKEEILRTITMPLRHPELAASGLRRSGLLLYGPPGTGKTLLAKAVATECNLNFLSVKGPELLNMYVGQSEENVREVFQRARCASPCIIFFDELDSLAPNRGITGDAGGVMDRVVSQLLAEMDGLQKSSQLFVIGATNRPDLIDPALLRPGRFDKLLYVGVCEDKDSQLSVMTALTRKFHLKADVNLEKIVLQLPANLTGADMYSLCSSAWMNAVKTCIKDHKEGKREITNYVEVSNADFQSALTDVRPSVSVEELRKFESLQHQIDSR